MTVRILDTLHVRRRSDLREAGLSDAEIRRLVEAGTVVALGRHWLGTADTPADVAAALRRHHRLTCVSALRHHRVWVPLVGGTHEAARRSGFTTDPCLVGHPPLLPMDLELPIASLGTSLDHACRCLCADDAAIVLESVAHQRLLGTAALSSLLAGLPLRTQRAIGRIDPRAESGTETRVRRALERRKVLVRPQVRIAGVGRVDLLVGERLILECDSRGHHTSVSSYAEDRRRDRAAVALGYIVVRLTWEDVMMRWETTLAMLLDLVRRGVHRRPRSQRQR